MTEASKPKSGMSTAVIVLIVIAAGGVPALGVVSALGIYGMTRYLREAKTAEGRAEATMLARGVVRCAATQGRGGAPTLPPSSAKVPASLSEVGKRKYMSTPADWSDPTFRCAGFSMGAPQYFQYEWEKRDDAGGVARATADLDGDGAPDVTIEVPVTCDASECQAGALISR